MLRCDLNIHRELQNSPLTSVLHVTVRVSHFGNNSPGRAAGVCSTEQRCSQCYITEEEKEEKEEKDTAQLTG